MPDQHFRGDPYRVLDVAPDASESTIKRRWRELAREHHPDKAAGDREKADELTGRMARINAAYDLLRDPLRRARYDGSAAGQRARDRHRRSRTGQAFEESANGFPAGPPPPPPTRPVTARFDTSTGFRPRNTTIGSAPPYHFGQAAPSRPPRRPQPEDLRASTPTGPVERRRHARPPALPSLREARETTLSFGKYGGYTLGEVELLAPGYIDWIAQTITRDRELVLKARVIQSELDRQGVVRRMRSPAPGFRTRAAS